MPNQLTLPFKSTPSVPLRAALRDYIQSAHTETHPDAFKWDINKWEAMRKDAVANIVHVATADKVIAYQAQLVYILTKLPVDINLAFPYTPAFPPHAPPVALSNLAYERANILYNLVALYCQLATSEDRAHGDGIKRAVAHFQNAAGTLSHLIASALPALESSLPPNTGIPDLSKLFLKALEWLMLAQAQECFWQRAVVDNMKNLLVAKLSSKTSSLYREALEAMEIDSATSALFTREWIAHVRTKQHHFAAAALYRKSVDDLEANRYGEELARLDMARAEAKKALDAARKSGVARTVQDDIKSLYDILETSYKRAERDNDLIYHHTVPSASSVPPIPEIKDVVTSIVPLGLRDPQTVVREGEAILGELNGWGVRVAVDIYKERRNDWIQLEIVDRAKELDAASVSTLQLLNLPAALDALDRPIGLPPSLLGKAEEVRLEDGMARIPALIQDVQRLARRDAAALDEALDVLDQEATEDEEMRAAYSVDVWTRPASHDANRELTEQAQRYREVLERAAESDRVVRDKWADWAERIGVLCWDEADIERAVPSATGGAGSQPTQARARALRAHLETLDDLLQSRAALLQRVHARAAADNPLPRFTRDAAALARWVAVRPELFEPAIEEELGKYERVRAELEEGAVRQEEVLGAVKERHVLFMEERRGEEGVRERERALQGLDLAYHAYRDIRMHLTEGIKFYNDFATILGQMKESCRAWVMQRRKDVEWLTDSLNGMNVGPPQSYTSTPPEPASEPQPQPPAPAQPPKEPSPARAPPHPDVSAPPAAAPDDFALDLPPPDSAAWETMAAAPAPSAYKKPRKSTRRVGA